MRSSLYKASFSLSIFVAFLLPLFVHADTLSISPSTGTYSAGKTFSVHVFTSSVAQSVNAVSGTITFPQDKLQVVSISRANSIVTLWVQDPAYSNTSGTISFEGVIPNPGFMGSSGDIMTVTFKVTGQGNAPVKFSSGAVLANDGNGTNVLKNYNTATYSLGSSAVPEFIPAVISEPETDPLTPKAPVVTSSSYPDSKKWYTDTIGRFTWKAPEDATAVRVLLGRLPQSVPTVVYTDIIESKEISDIEDGVWYFHVQFKNKHGWGGITHYMFKVDSVKPDTFTVKELPRDDKTDPKPRFLFSATDSASGIHHYDVRIDSADPQNWRDDGTGVYQTGVLAPGKHTLITRAYDEAGNYAVASVDFIVEPIQSPRIDSYTEKVTPDAPLTVRGVSLPNASVHVYLVKDNENVVSLEVKADTAGAFSVLYDKELPRGAYRLSAVAEDKRGARSEPSADKAVIVGTAWLASIGSTLVNILAVAVPVIALIFGFVFVVFWGIHKIGKFRKNIRRELREVESTVDKAFDLLKEDIEDSIHLLEHTKNKRMLTREEDEIISRFRKNLADAEKVIRKEIHDVEREIGDR